MSKLDELLNAIAEHGSDIPSGYLYQIDNARAELAALRQQLADRDWSPKDLKGEKLWWSADNHEGTTHVLVSREELNALRQRAEDAEMILRHALHSDLEGNWIMHSSHSCSIMVGETEDGDPIEVHLEMRDGLPILTDEARAALGRKA